MESFIHPQVDSGFGFTCDEKILPFVKAFYVVGLKTLGSCQEIHASSQVIVVSIKTKSYPRRWVAYSHSDPQTVFAFATHVRTSVQETDGWEQSIFVDHYTTPDVVYGTLAFVPSLDVKMLSIINQWSDKCLS